MADVYSLICWGGLSGKTVSLSASTDVVTLTNHGLRDGTKIWPSGTMPPELNISTPVYARSTATNTFTLHLTAADAINNTGQILFAGTSTYSALVFKSDLVADPVNALAPYGLSDLSRWGSSGSERIYDSIRNFVSVRNAATTGFDVEVAEIGEAFSEMSTSAMTFSLSKAPKTEIVSTVNGSRSAAYHNDDLASGFAFVVSTSGLQATGKALTIDGIVLTNAVGNSGVILTVDSINCKIIRNIVAGNSISLGTGIEITSTAQGCLIAFNLVKTLLYGINNNGAANSTVANNFVTGCGTGFYPASGALTYRYGRWINNISFGNTTDWFSTPTSLEYAHKNAGGAGSTPWTTAGNSSVTLASTDFFSYPSDLHPALSTSPQVDSAVAYYDAPVFDLILAEVPNYNNGGAESYDIGCYEFDHGYGPHPKSQTFTVSGAELGRIKIVNLSDQSEIYNSDVLPNNVVSNLTTNTNVDIYIRKGSAAPYFHPLKISAVIDVDAGLVYNAAGLQQEDIAAHDYSGTNVASDWTFNSSTGAIVHAAGVTRYSVQDLYSWHQDYYDDTLTVDDVVLMKGVTSTIFDLLGAGNITDSDLEDLFGGSIEFANGTLWSNLWTAGSFAGSPLVYVVQGVAKITPFWPTGHIDILLKVSNAGVPIEGGIVETFVRPWGYTYDNYPIDLSAGGRNVAPLSSFEDSGIVASEATVGGWNDVTVTFGTFSLDFGDGAGSRTYYSRIDCNGRPLSEVYQRAQYITRDVSTEMVNGVEGWRYKKAHATVDAVKIAPFGIYSGGVWNLAPTVWLDNVPLSDSTNYIVTDSTGDTHQNVETTNQSVTVSNLVPNSRVQILDTTNTLELVNAIVAGTSVSWIDPALPVGDREIRVRITYVVGTTAMYGISANIGSVGTTPSTSSLSYRADQKDNMVYETNAIDGALVTGMVLQTLPTPHYLEIDRSGGGVTYPEIYAFCVAYGYTEEGIRDVRAMINAPDTANYLFDDIDIRNVNAQPLTITGGYGRDAITGLVQDIIDVVGSTGNIYPAPDHVVPFSTGSGLTAGQDAKLSAIDSVCATFEFVDSKVDSHISMVAGESVKGSGTEADPWGPV